MTDHIDQEPADGDESTTPPTAEAAIAKQAIAAHADRIKHQELQQAYNRLGDNGTISKTERQIIEAMATAIVDDIIATPITALDETPDYDDKTVETALELFDPTE